MTCATIQDHVTVFVTYTVAEASTYQGIRKKNNATHSEPLEFISSTAMGRGLWLSNEERAVIPALKKKVLDNERLQKEQQGRKLRYNTY